MNIQRAEFKEVLFTIFPIEYCFCSKEKVIDTPAAHVFHILQELTYGV